MGCLFNRFNLALVDQLRTGELGSVASGSAPSFPEEGRPQLICWELGPFSSRGRLRRVRREGHEIHSTRYSHAVRDHDGGGVPAVRAIRAEVNTDG